MEEGPMKMTSELALFLEGSRLVGKMPLSPSPLVLNTHLRNSKKA
jgi:hypothetical protein